MFRHRDETFDIADGYDSCEWAARLAWSDGQVGTWGHSNASWLAWMLIASQPPSLKAALCSGIFKNALDLTFGIFETGRRRPHRPAHIGCGEGPLECGRARQIPVVAAIG